MTITHFFEVAAPGEQIEARAEEGETLACLCLTMDSRVAMQLAHKLLGLALDNDPVQLDMIGLMEERK